MADRLPIKLEKQPTIQDHFDNLEALQSRIDAVESQRASNSGYRRAYSMVRRAYDGASENLHEWRDEAGQVVHFIKIAVPGNASQDELMKNAPDFLYDKGEKSCCSGVCIELPCLDRYAPNVSGCCCCPPRYKELYYDFEKFFTTILPMLHTGDIVLGAWPVEDTLKISKFITHSKWSHVGMVYRPSDCPSVLKRRDQDHPETDPSRPLVVQLLNEMPGPDGVPPKAFNCNDFEQFFRDYLDKFTQFAGRNPDDFSEFEIAVRFLTGVDRNMAFYEAIEKTCDDFKDSLYFLPPMAGLDFCQSLWSCPCMSCMWAKSEKGYGFCSQFVAKCYQNAGLINPNLEAMEFIPSMFDSSRHIWLRNGAKLSWEHVVVGPATLEERDAMKFKGQPGHCAPWGTGEGVWGVNVKRQIESQVYSARRIRGLGGKVSAKASKPRLEVEAAPLQQDMAPPKSLPPSDLPPPPEVAGYQLPTPVAVSVPDPVPTAKKELPAAKPSSQPSQKEVSTTRPYSKPGLSKKELMPKERLPEGRSALTAETVLPPPSAVVETSVPTQTVVETSVPTQTVMETSVPTPTAAALPPTPVAQSSDLSSYSVPKVSTQINNAMPEEGGGAPDMPVFNSTRDKSPPDPAPRMKRDDIAQAPRFATPMGAEPAPTVGAGAGGYKVYSVKEKMAELRAKRAAGEQSTVSSKYRIGKKEETGLPSRADDQPSTSTGISSVTEPGGNDVGATGTAATGYSSILEPSAGAKATVAKATGYSSILEPSVGATSQPVSYTSMLEPSAGAATQSAPPVSSDVGYTSAAGVFSSAYSAGATDLPATGGYGLGTSSLPATGGYGLGTTSLPATGGYGLGTSGLPATGAYSGLGAREDRLGTQGYTVPIRSSALGNADGFSAAEDIPYTRMRDSQ